MDIQLPENFSSIQKMLVLKDPKTHQPCFGRQSRDVHSLLSIPREHGQVQNQGNPVSIDEEQESQKGVNGGFGDDVGVEAVAKINGVDVVAVKNVSLSPDTSIGEPVSVQDSDSSWGR